MSYLKISELKEGYLYKIKARNAHFGIWNPKVNAFEISRHKFGNNFVFKEYHIDCQDYNTATPLKEIEKSPFTLEDFKLVIQKDKEGEEFSGYLKEKEILDYLNKFEEQKLKEIEEERKLAIEEFKRLRGK
jgi:hypothetical protein